MTLINEYSGGPKTSSVVRLCSAIFLSISLAVGLQATVFFTPAGDAHAETASSKVTHSEVTVNDLKVKIRRGKRPSVAYLTLNNMADQDDALLSVTSDSFERVEIHTNLIENDVVKMRKLERLPLLANTEHVLKPMADHLMLFGKSKHLDTVSFTFNFKNAPAVIKIHKLNKTKSSDKTTDKHMKMSH